MAISFRPPRIGRAPVCKILWTIARVREPYYLLAMLPDDPAETLNIGLPLFIPYRAMEKRVFEALAAAGFDDFTPAQARLPAHRPRRQPADRPRGTGTDHQTVRLLVDQLERAGRARTGSGRRPRPAGSNRRKGRRGRPTSPPRSPRWSRNGSPIWAGNAWPRSGRVSPATAITDPVRDKPAFHTVVGDRDVGAPRAHTHIMTKAEEADGRPRPVPGRVHPAVGPRTSSDVVDVVFVYVVILNLAVEYVLSVISEGFTLSLLTAVLLKVALTRCSCSSALNRGAARRRGRSPSRSRSGCGPPQQDRCTGACSDIASVMP